MSNSVWQIHSRACDAGQSEYIDPHTGYSVFTRLGLLQKGRCCGAGCRHCPYAHESVLMEQRTGKIQQAAWLTKHNTQQEGNTEILFWSGGKDSYLAYLALQKELQSPRNIVLLTTFDASTGMIAHQNLHIDVIVSQANQLEVALLGVPLHPGQEYLDQLAPALALVPGATALCFGDLHLQHIREWREQAFKTRSDFAHLQLNFPLWGESYPDLLEVLEDANVECIVSAVMDADVGVSVGEKFDRDLVSRLPAHVDIFGENGEFHTRVEIN